MHKWNDIGQRTMIFLWMTHQRTVSKIHRMRLRDMGKPKPISDIKNKTLVDNTTIVFTEW